jgi:hypothetical protein
LLNASFALSHLRQGKTMESANALNRQTKAVLIAKLLTATKDIPEIREKVLGAPLMGE